MESSQFSDNQSRFDAIEQMESQGGTCDTFRVKLYGKLHFLKRLKAEYAGDIRYQEALRKEFETGYRLEHPNLVRYLSLDKDGILMEYVDGETLSQRLTKNPDYFKQRKNSDKLIRQLLSALQYLHNHQVLHLDLKPDNILLTHINNDVKLIDLGFCYTDMFADTQGHTNAFAAPEQKAGRAVDVRTDIYAFGKILELLPDHSLYNGVIARCTAENPEDRYQSIDELLYDINHRRRYFRYVAAFVAIGAMLAIGIALLLGFRFPMNFNAPYKSVSVTDFWRRWHISLSTWLRQYLYISLGGNRKGKLRMYLNLFMTMLLGGLWHGASWNFILWGALHGVALGCHKFFSQEILHHDRHYYSAGWRRIVAIIITFHFVCFCWIFFRCSDMETAVTMLNQVATNFHPELLWQVISGYPWVFGLMAFGIISHYLPDSWQQHIVARLSMTNIFVCAMLITAVIYIVIQVKSSDIQPFIYFQF